MEGLLESLKAYLAETSLLAYPLVFLFGVATSFTPCVYPVIPITASFIGASTRGSARRGVFLSLSYVFGMAVVYAALGALAALTGSLFGRHYQTLQVVVGGGVVVLSLSMLGLFTIPLPRGLAGLQPKKGGRGLLFACFVGMVSGLVVSPCTAPALGAVLAYVAGRQHILFGVTLLFTFALGMGLLLVLVGSLAGLAAALPKSGSWMEKVKRIFGVILLLTGIVFVLAGMGVIRIF